MRTPFLALLAAMAAAAIAQHQQQPQELDNDTQARIRAERSAGGVGKVTPEERASANVGAGPHMERTTEPARREPRDEALKSGDARARDRRP